MSGLVRAAVKLLCKAGGRRCPVCSGHVGSGPTVAGPRAPASLAAASSYAPSPEAEVPEAPQASSRSRQRNRIRIEPPRPQTSASCTNHMTWGVEGLESRPAADQEKASCCLVLSRLAGGESEVSQLPRRGNDPLAALPRLQGTISHCQRAGEGQPATSCLQTRLFSQKCANCGG